MSRKRNYIKNENEKIVSDDTLETEFNNDIEKAVAENIVSCKIIKRLPNDKAIVSINGCGLIISLNEKADVVNVKYTGNIGTPDFKYEVI